MKKQKLSPLPELRDATAQDAIAYLVAMMTGELDAARDVLSEVEPYSMMGIFAGTCIGLISTVAGHAGETVAEYMQRLGLAAAALGI